MRLTKKTIREARSAIQRRINQLRKMTREELEAEHKRMFPSLTIIESSDIDLVGMLIHDYVDRAIPEHWLF